MNDITALIKSMKASADEIVNKQWSCSPELDLRAPGSGFVTINGKKAVYCINKAVGGSAISLSVLNHIASANPSNVKTLVEALEKAQDSGKVFQQSFFRQSLMYDVVAEAYEEAKEQIAKDVEIKARLCRESNSLFDRLRAAEKRIAELEEKQRLIDICQGQGLEHRVAAEKRAETAERHIAELESRTVTVKLPKLHVSEVMLISGFNRDYAEGWCAGNDNARHEIQMAGIQVIKENTND